MKKPLQILHFLRFSEYKVKSAFMFPKPRRRVRFPYPAPNKKEVLLHLFFILSREGNRTHPNADVRWTSAATSANTGGFLYFLLSMREKKMQIDSCTLFYLSTGRESNPFTCKCPVDICCHQCKHWWLPLFSSLDEREENASRFPYSMPKGSVVKCVNFTIASVGAIINRPRAVNDRPYVCKV